jgi:hypothetical protein
MLEAYKLQNDALQRQLGAWTWRHGGCLKGSALISFPLPRMLPTPPSPPTLPARAAERTEKCLLAEKAVEQMKLKVREAEGGVSAAEGVTRDVAAELKRQFAAMQEGLQARIAELEGEAGRMKAELVATRAAVEEARREGAAVAAKKDAEIARLSTRLGDLTAEFADMLAEAIRKMADRIEIAPEGVSADGVTGDGVPVLKKMEDIAAQAGPHP